ncbi:hypothetical protein AAG614_11875 [Citromicrobium bathyomarinum]
MSAFRWTDRYGNEHDLETPEAIDNEAEEIATEIDVSLEQARKGSPEEVRRMRDQIRSLLGRHDQLVEDAKRWNAFALDQAKTAANHLIIEICDFLEEAALIVLPAALHEESVQELSDPSTRARLLDGPMTDWQRYAIEHSQIEPKPPKDATRGEALAWLNEDSAWFRPLTEEGGWFEWQDAEGAIHRLASPLRMEQEIGLIAESMDEIATELSEKLVPNGSLKDLTFKLELANILVSRLHVLKSDLERFERDQEDKIWKRFGNEWTQFRSAAG